MNLKPKSIKGRLFFWLFLCNSILLFIVSLVIYKQIDDSINISFNNTLHSRLDIITNLLENEQGKIELELTEFKTGKYNVPGSGHYYKVIINDQQIIESPSLSSIRFNLTGGKLESENNSAGEKTYYTQGSSDEHLKVLQKNIIFSGIPVTILVAEDFEKGHEIMENTHRIIFIVFPLAVIAFGIITFWLTKISLKPLEDFSEEVSSITHKNLDKKIYHHSATTELNKLILSFNDMLDRIRDAFDLEKLIISEASHKLKTPITVIKGYCDVILLREREKSEYIETLESINRVSGNISNLISGILTVTNLDSGHLTFQARKEIEINQIILKVIELSAYFTEQKKVEINFTPAKKISFNGDEEKLTEAIFNIVENAIKFNKENGFIDINVNTEKNKIYISIRDTGIGIKDDEINKIFERFYRSGSVRKIEGHGLGLNIAKTIVESHNGKISVNSISGNGSEFIIFFPLN